jgi:hypothetical protein
MKKINCGRKKIPCGQGADYCLCDPAWMWATWNSKA